MKVINLINGPSAGKSTVSTGLMSKMKDLGYNIEYVPEVAKGYTWEGNKTALSCQQLLFGEQFYELYKLRDKVEAVVTDTSLLLCPFYAKKYNLFGYSEEFVQFCINQFNLFDNIVVYLHRDPNRPYNPAGRNQSMEEAKALDQEIMDFIRSYGIKVYEVQRTSPVEQVINEIYKLYNELL